MGAIIFYHELILIKNNNFRSSINDKHLQAVLKIITKKLTPEIKKMLRCEIVKARF